MSFPVILDGNFLVATQNGPIVPTWDPITGAYGYRQPMCQLVSTWTQQPYSLTGPNGGYLTGESQPNIQGPLMYWDRVFWNVPATRTDPESVVYPVQVVESGGTSGPTLVEIPIPTTASAIYNYYNLAIPGTAIPQLRAYKLGMAGEQIYALGTVPSDLTNALLFDSTATRWKGRIWERKALYGNIPGIEKQSS